MFFPIGKPRSLDELDQEPANPSSLRRHLRIAIIDDEGFCDSRSSIEAHGYSMTELGDIASIDIVQPFHVVICDVKGVGMHFGSPKEGAHLLAEIRKQFPDKYLILHTRHSLDASYLQALRVADKALRKNTDPEVWVAALDEATLAMLSSKQRWLRMRNYLIQSASVDLFAVLKIEQQYIDAAISRSPSKMRQISMDGTGALPTIVGEFGKAVAADLAKDAIVAAFLP